MTSKDRNTIEHMAMRCDRVSEDIARFGKGYDIFIKDPAFHDSVSMNIMQIGELTKNLSDEFKESTKQIIPWKQIYDMRCRFAHGYGLMAESEIWNTAINDIPILKEFCELQLKEYAQNRPDKTRDQTSGHK